MLKIAFASALAAFAFAAAAAFAQDAATAPAAEAAETSNLPFTIIEADARIPATRRVNSFEVVRPNYVLLRVGANDWYAAEVERTCTHDLWFHPRLAIDRRGVGAVDHFSYLIVDGNHCKIESLSRVERTPRSERVNQD